MQLGTALTYPFKSENFKDTSVWPAVLNVIMIGIIIVMMIVMVVFMIAAGGNEDVSAGLSILFGLIMVIGMLIVMAPAAGYIWAMTGHWMENGFEAPALPWKDRWMEYTITGFHYYVISIIMFIPMILVFLSLGLFFPLLVGPYLVSSKERTVGAYFAAIGPGIELAMKNYGKMLLVTYLSLLLTIGYNILSMGVAFTMIGYFVCYVPMMWLYIAVLNLYVQQVGVPAKVQGGSASSSDGPFDPDFS